MVRDSACYWRHPALGGLDMMRARYVRHAFGWHSHPTFAIGALQAGEEEIAFPDGRRRARPGDVVVIAPGAAHTGRAGGPDGWTYRVLYPSVEQLTAVGGIAPATDRSGGVVLHDPELASTLLAGHREAEQGDPLAADTLIHLVLRRLAHRYARSPGVARPTVPDRRSGDSDRHAGADHAPTDAARRARELLQVDLTAAPTLTELAAMVGCRPFGLLRTFRRIFGMPPHTFLTNIRVTRARQLLEAGLPPADVAQQVGFCDQSHLTRHFRRLVGVPPAAYQRGVQERPRIHRR